MNLFPKYSSKGKKLYHRKSTLTPEQRLVSDFFERFKEEGIISSPSNETVMGLQGGFLVSFLEEDGAYTGLAYKKDRGRDIQIETPRCPTRRDADIALNKYIQAYNGNK